MSIGNEILNQLGGLPRISIMLGKVAILTYQNGLTLKFKNPIKNKPNTVKFYLSNDDTYFIEFYRVTGVKVKKLRAIQGVMVCDLHRTFQENTGLDIRL